MAKRHSTDELSAEHELLLAYIEGELNPQQEAAFEATMAGREDLTELTRLLRRDRKMLGNLADIEPPQDLTELAIDRLERRLLLDGIPHNGTPRKAPTPWGRWASYATAAVICLTGGAVLWQNLTTGSSLFERVQLAQQTPPPTTPEQDAQLALADAEEESPIPLRRSEPETAPTERGQATRAEVLEETDAVAADRQATHYGTMRGDEQAVSAPALKSQNTTAESAEPVQNQTVAFADPRMSRSAGLISSREPQPLVIPTRNPEVMVNIIEQWAHQRALPVRRIGNPGRPMTLENLLSGKGFERITQPGEQTVTLEIEAPPYALESLRLDLTQQEDSQAAGYSLGTPLEPLADRSEDTDPLQQVLDAIDMPGSLRQLIPMPRRVPLDQLAEPPQTLRIRIIRDLPNEETSVDLADEVTEDADPPVESDADGDSAVAPGLAEPDAGENTDPGTDSN